jgi:hypothetical protein
VKSDQEGAGAFRPQADEKGASASEPSPDATTPIQLDLTSSRLWGSAQTWHQSTPLPSRHHPHRP